MKSLLRLIVTFTAVALVGCKVSVSHLFGDWNNPDGAKLVLKSDGSFSAHALPARVFLRDGIEWRMNGTGQWKLENHSLLWSGDKGLVRLSFEDAPGYPPRMEVQFIVSGDGNLFQWKGEEGGERYELRKTQ